MITNPQAQSHTACCDCIALGMLAADNKELTAVCAGLAGVPPTGVSVEEEEENLLRLGGDASYSIVGASVVAGDRSWPAGTTQAHHTAISETITFMNYISSHKQWRQCANFIRKITKHRAIYISYMLFVSGLLQTVELEMVSLDLHWHWQPSKQQSLVLVQHL
jgi:hypothetical protein